jgi:acyl-CoA synthetase (AMP-forming)/AMP-acid ligase II
MLHHFLHDAAVRYADKPSLIFVKKTPSFREIDEASDRLACGLQRLGVRVHDGVAAILDNSLEMLASLWATLKAAVFVPASHGVKADKLAFLLGGGVALGYLVELELTAEKYVEDPFAPWTGPIVVAFRLGRAVASEAEKLSSGFRPSRRSPTARSRPLRPSPELSVAAKVRPCR